MSLRKPLRIAHLGIKGLPSQGGGSERAVEGLVKRQALVHQVTVYCSSAYTPPGSSMTGVRLVRVPCLRGKYAHMVSANLMAASHAIAAGGYDVVNLHGIENSFVALGLRLRYPVVITARGRPYMVEKWPPAARRVLKGMEWLYLKLGDICTSVSQPHALECQQRYGCLPRYIPNGVELPTDAEIAAASPKASALVSGADQYVAFATNRIIPCKGCHLLFAAMRSVPALSQLMVIGHLDSLPAYGEELKLAAANDPRIRFLPFTPGKADLMALIARAKLFVLPSTTEGMSMMLLECAMLGVPILASDIQDNVAVMGDTAFYFKSGDSSDLAEQLRHVLGAPDRLREFAVRARERVLKQFTWEHAAQEYERAYADAMARRGRSRPELGAVTR